MKKILMTLAAVLVIAVLASPAFAQSGVTDDQVSTLAQIKGSKIEFPNFATVTDGSVPSARTYLNYVKRPLKVGDIIKKTGTAQYYVCTSTTGPAWKLISASGVGTGDGSATTPAYNFLSDTNTGMYWIGADQIGFSTGGTLRLTLSTALLTSTLPLVLPAGTAMAPAMYFAGDVNTGLYSVGAEQIGVSTNGVLKFTFGDTGSVNTSAIALSVPLGTTALNGLHFGTDVNTGLYSSGANAFSLIADGAAVANVTAGFLTIPTGVDLAIATGGDLTIADAPVAGTDAANKTYVDGIQNTVMAKGVAVDLNTADVDQTLLTPCAGATGCIVTGIIIRAPTGAGCAAGAPNVTANYGWNGNGAANGGCNDVAAQVATATFGAATDYLYLPVPAPGGTAPTLGAAAGTLCMEVQIAAGGVCTATVDVIGFSY